MRSRRCRTCTSRSIRGRLLHLRYDGAVDPTSYLDEWRREGRVVAALPVHPRLPSAAAARAEAEQNFRELLAARGVEPRRQPGRPTPKLPPTAQLPLPLVRAAAPVPRTPNTSGLVWPLLAGVAAAAGAAALYLRAGRRKSRRRQTMTPGCKPRRQPDGRRPGHGPTATRRPPPPRARISSSPERSAPTA